ncbi:MAG: vitamin K epoxide reductase family protein, partial [Gemmatimonadetes bacterium]|nr:vitamin K epoxide reductase family protein [Gemmatimonadota bacterium]
PWARFLRDPVANGIALAVLAGLLVVLGWSVGVLTRPAGRGPAFPGWLFPVLGLVGAGVAAYLSFVEVTGAAAVCGPVGDCNAVQQSPWARLFGVLPVGVLGLAGYVGLMAAWAVGTWGPAALRARAWTGMWAMALIGTAFSAYLTFLEPFVIGATCAWCLTSAAVMALMLVGATGRAAAPPPPV